MNIVQIPGEIVTDFNVQQFGRKKFKPEKLKELLTCKGEKLGKKPKSLNKMSVAEQEWHTPPLDCGWFKLKFFQKSFKSRPDKIKKKED